MAEGQDCGEQRWRWAEVADGDAVIIFSIEIQLLANVRFQLSRQMHKRTLFPSQTRFRPRDLYSIVVFFGLVRRDRNETENGVLRMTPTTANNISMQVNK